MNPMNNRLTLDKVDRTKPQAEWKASLADFGRRRHLSYTLDFDTRSYLFKDSGKHWSPEARRLHQENQERVRQELGAEFGRDHLDKKVDNFVAIGTEATFSVLAYHNKFFDHVRRAFVIGAYYPPWSVRARLGKEF